MKDCGKNIALAREGSSQFGRFIDALNPNAVQLNDLSLGDWMKFAFNFAKHINYFDTNNSEKPVGNWQSFFKDDKPDNDELSDFLKRMNVEHDMTPHLALFVAFVLLLEYPQKSFNLITKRHLDFYYNQVLQIEKLQHVPDQVHLIFELAQKATDELIVEGTELNGEKDAIGKNRIYKTTDDIVVNQAAVAELKSLYNSQDTIKMASVANSWDGKGADFPVDQMGWWTFGYNNLEESAELEDAKLGFALSSAVLNMKEGERNVQIKIKFTKTLTLDINNLVSAIEIWCTGEKEWIGPFHLETNSIYRTDITDSSKSLMLAFTIPADESPMVPYNQSIHGEHFITNQPVCRMLLKTENDSAYECYQKLLDNEIKSLEINIDVRGAKELKLENDIGIINSAKPFYPFGTQPVKHSSFYIDYPELFEKNWGKIDVEINWKNTPDSFKDLYFAYRKNYLYKANTSIFIQGMLSPNEVIIQKARKENRLLKSLPLNDFTIVNNNPGNLIVEENSHFKANIEIKNKEKWEKSDLKPIELFKKETDRFVSAFSVENDPGDFSRKGPVRISLLQSFYHELFPRIYALAFKSNNENALIPNEPYTPLIDTISLNYTASSKADIENDEHLYLENPVKLFHEHPFGQAEEHLWLKNQFAFIENKNKTFLLPRYANKGELFIGLANAEPLQNISLLVQLIEGTENPSHSNTAENQSIEWSVLVQNEWKPLDSNYMIENQIDNFLKSGIVKFSIPKEANKNNTLLTPGLIWVKASMNQPFDAVCKCIAIHAQAVVAKFDNDENDLSHLENGLPPYTISKLNQRSNAIKSVEQPYSSFGGKPQESDAEYYRRISERLRHKNRAVTLWDYEQLILQQFPKIHKAKCLNHTSEESLLAPGNVLVVVIPDIVNNNVFDIFQPRLSKAKLNEIENFLNSKNSLHVRAKVDNPDYEEVEVSLKVKFRKGFDENYYKKVLNDDIIRLLSPWAFQETAEIDFGRSLHLSRLIYYLEKLAYVDYVEDVKMKKGDRGYNVVTPDSPKAILVSAKKHNIYSTSKTCNRNVENKEK